MAMPLDQDLIDNTALDEVQKARVQDFRDFYKAMVDKEQRDFRDEVDAESFDCSNHRKVVQQIAIEDARFLPVIACAYADDLLKEAFTIAIPKSVPGGVKSMLGGYGPLSSLAHRIQLAYSFNLITPYLLRHLDKMRGVRNEISHTWSIASLANVFEHSAVSDLPPVEEIMKERLPNYQPLNTATPAQLFRVRLCYFLWIIAYEAPLYWRASQRRSNTHDMLYGKYQPKRLGRLGSVTLDAIEQILAPGYGRDQWAIYGTQAPSSTGT